MLALIDGDLIAYRAAAASVETYDWGDTGGLVGSVDHPKAVELALRLVEEWRDGAGCTDVIVCLTGDDKFRRRLLPTYQNNRKDKRPIDRSVVRATMMSKFPWKLIEGLEADDVMGILATTLPKYEGAVMVSIDKDLKTVPGRHLNPNKDTKVVTVTDNEADYLWMMQTLTGDTSDGYTGIPGVGPKGAAKILQGNRTWVTMWPSVVRAYHDHKLTEADALVQARMARILRREDYRKEDTCIRLWHPTTPVWIPVLAPTAEPNPESCTGPAASNTFPETR